MIQLAIKVNTGRGHTTHYFDPQKDCDEIYDFLTEKLGWGHEAAENAASWAETACCEDVYETDDSDVEIFFVER